MLLNQRALGSAAKPVKVLGCRVSGMSVGVPGTLTYSYKDPKRECWCMVGSN